MQLRRDDDGRAMGLRLERARRHGVLERRLLVRVPRRRLLGIGVERAVERAMVRCLVVVVVVVVVMLLVVVGRGIGIVVDGRVCLGRHRVVVVLRLVPSAARQVRAGHRGRWRPCCLDRGRWREPSQPACAATGRGECLVGLRGHGIRTT